MSWLIEPFQDPANQQALVAALLAAVALAVVGTWVVIRGMSFLGDALAHGVIPGIAAAVLLDFSPLLGAAIAALVMTVGVGMIHRQTTFSEDTGIGLLFVGMLALGVLITSRSPDFPEHVTDILFGETLEVGSGDVIVIAIIAGVIVIAAALMHRPFLVLSFNEQKARLVGMRPSLTHTLLLVLITLAVVGSFQSVGTLLVFGLLIGPPATAALIARRVPVIMVSATGLGLLSVVVGMVISHHFSVSPSATMALTPIVMFFGVLSARSILEKRQVALAL